MLMGSVLRLHHLLWSESRRHCRRSFSSSSFSSCSSTTPSPSSTPSDPILGNPTPGKMSRFLKFGFFGAVAGVLGSAGYATYVYTADEVDDMTKAFRTSIDRTKAVDAASNIEVDLSKLNRDPLKILYVSGHVLETCLQPENCVPIKPWRKEADDTTLLDLLPFLEYVGFHRHIDVRSVLASFQGKDIASEFITRSKEHQRRMLEGQRQGSRWVSNWTRQSTSQIELTK